MFFRIILLCFCSMCFLRSFHVSSCDHHCADKPVFTPSRLVVKFGDPTSARCFACQRECLNNLFDLEKSVGSSAKNGTTISWTVDRMTEWDTSAQCYYNNGTGYQCCTFLPITVYQPPDNVSISFVNHTGPMFEGHQYTLQCTVQDVAPVENLTVTFYRGQTALSQQQSNYSNIKKTPVNEIFTLDINATKEDDGVQYWCEAELQLGPEGPQQPPVEISPKLTATVNYLELTSTRLPPTTPTTRKTTTPTTRKTTTPTTRKTTTPTTRKTTTPTTRKTTTPTTRKTTTPTTRKTTTTPSSSASSKRVHWIIMCFMFEFSVLV